MGKSTAEMILFVEANNEGGMEFILVNKRHMYYMSRDAIKMCAVNVDYEHPDDLNEKKIRMEAIQLLKDKQDKLIDEANRSKKEIQNKIDQLILINIQTEKDDDDDDDGVPF